MVRVRWRWFVACVLAAVSALYLNSCARSPLKPTRRVVSVDERLRPPPDTQNVVFESVDKVDLLFVLDNSPSMADKQQLLSQAVPTLLERLINPPCISEIDRNDVREVDGPEVACPPGFVKEFEPLIDLHVGVVTSSLGGHGGQICSPDSPQGNFNETRNDRGHLLGSVRRSLPSYGDAGFLAWDPAATKSPPGVRDVASFMQGFQSHVNATGEVGCGYEATQEAWYRFLVEPDPYLEITNDGAFAELVSTDTELLAQREAFLRPDSLLMLVVLSDEDDCSVQAGGIGWLVAQATTSSGVFTMPPATSACESDPNSACCRSCGLNERSTPAGCQALAEDSNCQQARPSGTDSLNLRCHNQKQRFGFDLLYPVERYSDALREPFVFDTRHCGDDADCPLVKNPLFEGSRDPSLIVYTAIVGVPWQDIATAESLSGPGLEYLTSAELEQLDRWQLLLGDPATGAPPGDPLMIRQPAPREGAHPITGEPLGRPESTNPFENSVNGHETINVDNTDLQYVCIYPLESPRDCSPTAQLSCDCSESDVSRNRPLCQHPAGGPAGTTQYFAKAYPGTRHLEVARQLGPSAAVASICPKLSQPPTSATAYGYNAAADHMYQRLAGGLGERCLSNPLPHSSAGRAECVLWQLRDRDCDCEAQGLRRVAPEARTSVEQMLAFQCAFRNLQSCALCACEVPQFDGSDLNACQTSAVASNIDGWCSIDPAQGVGDAQFVTDCRAGNPRTVRLLGRAEALRDDDLFLTCPE